MKNTLVTVPVKKINLADEVASQLKTLILEGKINPGDRLPSESAMAEMFSVGRTSVREALKAMHAIGLIDRSKKGTVVRKALAEPYKELFLQLITKKHNTEQLYEARMIFEIMLVKLAAQRATEEDLAEIKKHLDQMDTSDYKSYIIADVEFHVAVAEATQNPILFEAYQVIKNTLAESVTDLVDNYPQVLNVSIKQHRALYEAIANQDEELAESIIKEHLASLITFYDNLELEDLK